MVYITHHIIDLGMVYLDALRVVIYGLQMGQEVS